MNIIDQTQLQGCTDSRACSKAYDVKGLHQGSESSPLLFVIIMEGATSRTAMGVIKLILLATSVVEDCKLESWNVR